MFIWPSAKIQPETSLTWLMSPVNANSKFSAQSMGLISWMGDIKWSYLALIENACYRGIALWLQLVC